MGKGSQSIEALFKTDISVPRDLLRGKSGELDLLGLRHEGGFLVNGCFGVALKAPHDLSVRIASLNQDLTEVLAGSWDLRTLRKQHPVVSDLSPLQRLELASGAPIQRMELHALSQGKKSLNDELEVQKSGFHEWFRIYESLREVSPTQQPAVEALARAICLKNRERGSLAGQPNELRALFGARAYEQLKKAGVIF